MGARVVRHARSITFQLCRGGGLQAHWQGASSAIHAFERLRHVRDRDPEQKLNESDRTVLVHPR